MLLAWGKKTTVSVTSENNANKTAAPQPPGSATSGGMRHLRAENEGKQNSISNR